MMKDDVRKWLSEQFGDETETIAIVWNEYLGETTKQLAAARDALAAADYPALDRIAHTLKGNALIVGDGALVTAAVALRDAAKAGDGAGAAEAIGRLAALDGENRA